MESSPNRARLIASARQLFAQHGYSGVSVDDIAAHASLTKGAVYYQFKDKADIFAAACALIVSELVFAIAGETMAETIHSVDEIVTGSARLFAAYEREDVRQLLLLDGPVVLGPSRWRAIMTPMHVELAEHALGHLADAGRLDHTLVPTLAEIISGAFHQAVMIGSREGATREDALSARRAYEHLVSGLLKVEFKTKETARL